jgi:regulator of sigma E protease
LLFVQLGLIGIESLSPTVGEVIANSSASKYNIQPQDRIIQINQTQINDWRDIFPNLQQNNNGQVNLIILRNNEKISLTVQLQKNNKQDIWLLGIKPDITKKTIIKYDFGGAIKFGFDSTVNMTLILIDGVKQLITNAIGLDQLGGFISIIDYTAQASEVGLNSLFFILALLSINLAVLNLLPIPALDGGQIILTVYEVIRGKRPNEKIYYYLIIFSWIILMSLMLIGIINDINRLVE